MTDDFQKGNNLLAFERTVTFREQTPLRINAELRLLMSKRDATDRRYCRTGSRQVLDKFLDFANVCEEENEAAPCAYMHNRPVTIYQSD